jgi:zinc ribbon protein
MAVTCAHCGTVNPDGNTICSSCGMPLGPVPAEAAATASDTPPAAPDLPGVALPNLNEPIAVPTTGGASLTSSSDPTNFLPPGYSPGASPYLAKPAYGAAPPHRTGRFSVIAIVGIISVVFGGAGAVEAALRTNGSSSTSTSPPANVPPSTTSGTQQTQTSATGLTTTPFASVYVPSGFSINDQASDYIVLTPNNNDIEAVGLQSEPLTVTTTNAELDQDLLAGDQKDDDPTAKFCSTAAPTHTALVGSGGFIKADVITICENVTPSSGPKFAAIDGFVDAVAMTSSGSYEAIWVEIFSDSADYQSFSNSLPTELFTSSVFKDASPLGS